MYSSSPGETVLTYETKYWKKQKCLVKQKEEKELWPQWLIKTNAPWVFVFVFHIFSFSCFFCHLRVKFAEGSRALDAHLSLFLHAAYICSLCPTGIQLGFGLHMTIQGRWESEAEDERERQRGDEELRRTRRKENHFCFHKPHVSYAQSQTSEA